VGLSPAALLNEIADALAAALAAEGQGDAAPDLPALPYKLTVAGCPKWELPIEAAQMEEEKLAVIAARQEKWAADRDAARREALEEAAVFVEGHPTRNPTRNPNKYHNEDCFHAIAGQLRVLAAASALHKEGELTEQQVSTAICYRQDDFTEHSTLDIPTTTYRLNAALRAASSSLPLQRTLPDDA